MFHVMAEYKNIDVQHEMLNDAIHNAVPSPPLPTTVFQLTLVQCDLLGE